MAILPLGSRLFWLPLAAVYGFSSRQNNNKPFHVFFDSSNKLHRDMSPLHPEQPRRISVCLEKLQELQQDYSDDRIQLHDVAKEPESLIHGLVSRYSPFTHAELEHARNMLLQALSDDLVLKLEENTRASIQQRLRDGKSSLGHMGYIDNDTYITTASLDVCLRATAAWIRAIDVAQHEGVSMALTRPPGHHATAKGSNGFCLFNFAAAAALHVLSKDPMVKVSIIDTDVHYGQGVSDIVQHYPNIRYASIHQKQCFPHMGETLSVLGPHANVYTVPVPPESTWTCGFEEAFNGALNFLIQPNEWEPNVVIVCAGFDALDSDELASCSLVAKDYYTMTELLFQKVATLAPSNNRQPYVMLGLEGGYQLSKTAGGGGLADALAETVKAILMQQEDVAGASNTMQSLQTRPTDTICNA
ncbi:hypothetical protein MPSEU_000273000 [Mayamaea pseudoterrestris]|nr:hypothetical protein MPSEU_000273000 [Mayamaea pseudoterrestris]